MARSDVVVVIPAYNEANTIEHVVCEVLLYASVIVVDDGSSDMTSSIANKVGALVVQHSENLGYDEAINSGFTKAYEENFLYVITFDADGQHDASFLQVFIDELVLQKKDLVLGWRPGVARLSEWIFMLYTFLRFRWHDPLCGMKGYSIDLYKELGKFDSITSIGTELSVYALYNDFDFIEVRIPIKKRKDSPRLASSFCSNMLIIRALFRVILKY